MKRFSSIAGRILISALFMFLLFYSMLPAVNLRDRNFILYLIACILIFLAVNFLTAVKDFIQSLRDGRGFGAARDPVTGRVIFRRNESERPAVRLVGPLKYGFAAIAALILLMALASALGLKLFNAARYRDLIHVTEGDFSSDVAELSMSQIPVVDKDTASRLGNKKLGEMTDLVSQFEILNNYTQINYQGAPYRVTPLSYADPIKWLYNQRKGLPAYIAVNMVNQDTNLVWLDSGMKYSTSEYFFRNIYRYIRFRYPSKIFETVSFETDDEGTPYWVAPTIAYRIGWWDGKDIDGAVLVNAVTGESRWYAKDEVPQWIDQLYDSNLIIEQLDDNGRFQNGYFNSLFGQRGVRRTTYGYNYLAIDDDVYLYTGMSSVTSDESNIGFVLVNLRTKETRFYTVPGATELAAMESARGQVQHLNYSATFPLLLNISDRPAYFISLKDAAGLVKMYAFVDVGQYQIVGTGQTIDEAKRGYRTALNLEDAAPAAPKDTTEISGRIEAAASAVISGNTCYYFTLEGETDIYTAFISVSEQLPFIRPGDTVHISFTQGGQVREIMAIEVDAGRN
ncbi:CvpA family protein [Otoolea muris]|uniref:CvpA family protein n=1 Tax=Otoolea muris TaxID=2941515 RepID=UPI0020404C0E|nr:CvpA family protein [Otoolea muris]